MMRLLRLFIIMALCACGPTTPPAAITGILHIQVPVQAMVGEVLPVVVSGAQLAEQAEVTLTVVTSAGVWLEHAKATQGRAQFALDGQATQAAGVVLLTAQAGAAHGLAQSRFEAGPPVEPLEVLVGPRTVVANNADRGMAVVIPHDVYGNALTDGADVRVRVAYPDLRQIDLPTKTRDGVAWVWVQGGMLAGRIVISANSANRRGREADLLAVAGWPIPFQIYANKPEAAADGRQLIVLQSDVIRDQFGNPLSDGTVVQFVAYLPDGSQQRIVTQTVHGVAEAIMQAANTPGTAQIVATVRGIASEPYTVRFTDGPAIGTFPLSATLDTTQRLLVMHAGPLIGSLDQLAPDGTMVRFVITDSLASQMEVFANSTAGMVTAQIGMDTLAPGNVHIVALAGDGRGTAQVVVP